MAGSKYVSKFIKENAPPAHNGTILAGRVLPESFKPPFGDAWGYLESGSIMEEHSHPTEEIYIVVNGTGFCHVGGERFTVAPGDVVEIPPGMPHTMECLEGETLLWAAFWWEREEELLSVLGEGDAGVPDEKLIETLKAAVDKSGPSLIKVLILPPDYSRLHSAGGKITAMLVKYLREKYGSKIDVMPALGTHERLSAGEAAEFFGPEIDYDKLIVHDWRNDVVKLGEVPASFVREISEGLMDERVDVEVNRRVVDKAYDLVISVGQVVPHEVVGMANHNKNIFVGCGGSSMISSSHMLGAFYGLEKMMGKADTPVRKLFNYAEDNFLRGVPLLYLLTVTTAENGRAKIHGLFAGRGRNTFTEAVKLSQKKNMIYVAEPLKKVVVFLDGQEFKSTWIGNKAVYRTRMAIADGGELIVLAPGVSKFGEDKENDRLIRKYGYVGRERVLGLFGENDDLRQNRSVPAHLIHGSSDGKFSITYAVKKLTRDEVTGVGFKYADYDETIKKYDPAKLTAGRNILDDGEEIYFIPNPAVGLWVYEP